ncbi:MAG: NAD(P)-dependent oxidoreductase [Parcubacteria group bacterium]
MKILVTIHPFGISREETQKSLQGFDVIYNEKGRKYTGDELKDILQKINPDIIIAGTEKYSADILDLCPNLKMISRAGVGVDAIDLMECHKRKIIVTYTPDVASHAVAELTIGQMLNCLRFVQKASGQWQRLIGKSIKDCVVGVFGYGRIGKEVVKKLQSLEPQKILINDINNLTLLDLPQANLATKEEIIRNSDIITFHIPLIEPALFPAYNNQNFFAAEELLKLKSDSIIINTSRGGIINESDLFDWLSCHPEGRAAVDVFCEEPYAGALRNLDNAYLTPHIGSCTEKCRYDMEVGAVKEVLAFTGGGEFVNRLV